jgi:hypothetical protein
MGEVCMLQTSKEEFAIRGIAYDSAIPEVRAVFRL